MKTAFLRGPLLAAAAAAALAGCATDSGGGRYAAEATRFHLGQPIARGQIAIEAADPSRTGSLEYAGYADAVARQLARLGWTVVPANARTEQVAIIAVEQGTQEQLRSRPAVSLGVGGGTGGWHSGVGGGAGVSFPIGGHAKSVVATTMEVRIKRRSDSTVFWEGRARTMAPAGSAAAAPAGAAEKLAAALFQDFPGESGRTITLR
jgi:hypothetical protein